MRRGTLCIYIFLSRLYSEKVSPGVFFTDVERLCGNDIYCTCLNIKRRPVPSIGYKSELKTLCQSGIHIVDAVSSSGICGRPNGRGFVHMDTYSVDYLLYNGNRHLTIDP